MYQVFTSAVDERGIECVKTWCTDNEIEAAHWRKEGCQVIHHERSVDEWQCQNENFVL